MNNLKTLDVHKQEAQTDAKSVLWMCVYHYCVWTVLDLLFHSSRCVYKCFGKCLHTESSPGARNCVSMSVTDYWLRGYELLITTRLPNDLRVEIDPGRRELNYKQNPRPINNRETWIAFVMQTGAMENVPMLWKTLDRVTTWSFWVEHFTDKGLAGYLLIKSTWKNGKERRLP